MKAGVFMDSERRMGAECRLATPILPKYERETPERNIAQGDAAHKSADVFDGNYPLQHGGYAASSARS
jgi:hypothetical protein